MALAQVWLCRHRDGHSGTGFEQPRQGCPRAIPGAIIGW